MEIIANVHNINDNNRKAEGDMSKMNCSCCSKPMESRALQNCKACNSYMCQDCYDMNSGYCNECQQSMEMYE